MRTLKVKDQFNWDDDGFCMRGTVLDIIDGVVAYEYTMHSARFEDSFKIGDDFHKAIEHVERNTQDMKTYVVPYLMACGDDISAHAVVVKADCTGHAYDVAYEQIFYEEKESGGEMPIISEDELRGIETEDYYAIFESNIKEIG